MEMSQVTIAKAASYEPNAGEFTGTAELRGEGIERSTIRMPDELVAMIIELVMEDPKVVAIAAAHDLEEPSNDSPE